MQNPHYSKPVEAIRAPIDGSPIIRAAYVPEDRPYQVCTRCVMDSTDPEIVFDDQGVCSHCHSFDKRIRPAWPSPEEGQKKLEEMLDLLEQQSEEDS